MLRKPDGWQKESWAFFRSVPPITFGAGFKGSALSRVRPYPAVILNADEPPVSLADAVESSEPEAAGITADLAAAAEAEFGRLANSRGGIPGIMDAAGVCLGLAGECYLVGFPATDDEDERWGVYSSSAVDVKNGVVSIKERSGAGKGEPLPEGAFLARIWCVDPEWPGDPWSNMRAALGAAEEYVIWARVFRAIAKSGANGGILTMPTELDQEPPVPVGEDPGPQDDLTPLQRSYVDYATESIESDDTVAAAVPWILDGAYGFLDRVTWINTARSIDQKVLDRLDVLVAEIAHGVDLPVEVLKGMGASNHWSAWMVSDDTWKAHVEPVGQVFTQGLASAFLRPGLIEMGFPPEVVRRVVVALDPSALVARPNRAADAKELHAKGAISDDALRQALSFADADAPEYDELLRRYWYDRSTGSPQLTAEVMNRTVTEDDPVEIPSGSSRTEIGTGEPDDATPPEEGGEPVPATLPAAARALPDVRVPLALTAAADDDEDDPWWLLGLALARIESRLLDRLTVAASDDSAEALRKAGSRLRSQAQGNPVTKERVRDVAAEDVAAALGPELVAAMADPDTLLSGSLERLRDRWDAWVAAAQAQVADQLSRVADLAPDPAGAKAAIEAFRDAAPAARADGWAEAQRQLRGLLSDRLTGNIIDVLEGEGDPTSHVPAGVLRDALARAGGGLPGVGPSGSAQHAGPAGLTTGPTVRALLDALGATTVAWRWDHGFSANPFQPHSDLDGYEFDRWDDPRLAGPGSWPPVAHLHPGDHKGCSCGVTPVINGPTRQRAGATPDPGADMSARLRDTIYDLGDESLTLAEAFTRSQSTPVTKYGLRHGEKATALERAVDRDTMTPTAEPVALDGMLTTQASVNPHYIVKLYEDPLAAVEYDRALADDFPDYRPEVARGPDGTLVLIDGHHRGIAEAARSGTGTFMANVYDVDPSLTAAAGTDRTRRLYGRAAALAAARRARNGGT